VHVYAMTTLFQVVVAYTPALATFFATAPAQDHGNIIVILVFLMPIVTQLMGPANVMNTTLVMIVNYILANVIVGVNSALLQVPTLVSHVQMKERLLRMAALVREHLQENVVMNTLGHVKAPVTLVQVPQRQTVLNVVRMPIGASMDVYATATGLGMTLAQPIQECVPQYVSAAPIPLLVTTASRTPVVTAMEIVNVLMTGTEMLVTSTPDAATHSAMDVMKQEQTIA